jgi:conserved hypothetical protein TIGR02391
MIRVPSFSKEQVEALAKALGGFRSGSEITRALDNCGLEDKSGESTKWCRLLWVFNESQKQYQCANQIISFIKAFLKPVHYTGRKDDFEAHRQELNVILAFSGLEYGSDGEIRGVKSVKTLDEAEERVQTILAKFRERRIHPNILKYCRSELMQENYFHAVFEATKGLAQCIRDKSGIQEDGAPLIDKVFSGDEPILAFNALKTKTERSEHNGFAMLLKGCFGAIRNPLAHEPKILWHGEDDAADYLSLISLLHWKLDDCYTTGLGGSK